MRIKLETIAGLRLFEGMSLNDIYSIVNNLTFNMIMSKPGKIVKRQGDRCSEMLFLVKGEIKAIYKDKDAEYEFEEIHTCPHVIEPYSLFGISPYYQRSYVALDDVELMSVEKRIVFRLIERYEVFRLNYLNYMCSCVSHSWQKCLPCPGTSISEKIIQFILRLSEVHRGNKTLRIKKCVLARYLDESSRSLSVALREMEERGMLKSSRERIILDKSIFEGLDF